MVVIPITGSLLGFFLLPFLPGIFWKIVAAIFVGQLVLAAVVGAWQGAKYKGKNEW